MVDVDPVQANLACLDFCMFKAVITFKMQVTSSGSAEKHAEDPASDITLAQKN